MTKGHSLIGQSPYRASLTRDPFLFYEIRTTATLLSDGMNDEQALERIISGNLYQYPTEKSVRRMSKACIARLRYMSDTDLIDAIAHQAQDVAKRRKSSKPILCCSLIS